jgi:signal transduction histidine kinase
MAHRTLVLPRSVLTTASARVHERAAGSFSGLFRTPLIAVLLAIGYYLGTLLGVSLKPAYTSMATFWPPSAILLAAFLLAPVRMWWTFLLAVLPVHLLAQVQAGGTVLDALGWFMGNTGGPLIAAICMRSFKKKSLFDSVTGMIVFLGFGVVVTALLKSLLDAAVAAPTGFENGYWISWATRLSANMISCLTIVPTIVLLGQNGLFWMREATIAKWVEAGLLALGVLFASILVFGKGNMGANGILWLIYAPLPLLLWAAVRFGVVGVSASALVLALISAWEVSQGRGPLTGVSMSNQVLSQHIRIGTLAVSLMLLLAAIAEHRRDERSLRNELIHSQEQERYRVARDLLEDIVQPLILIGVQIDKLKTDFDDLLNPPLDKLREQVSIVSEATRNVSHELHPFIVEYLGIAKAIKILCRDTDAQTSLNISFNEENVPLRLPMHISLCLYRVTQEALQNIVKGSRARSVAIALKVSNGRAFLQIADDGAGDPQEQSIGIGIMRERLAALNGTLEIRVGHPDKGKTIVASVPLELAS